MQGLLFAVLCLFCAAVFGGISGWAFSSRKPVHFWAGSTVKPEEISDIPAYNRANGILWAVYAGGIALSGAIGLADMAIGRVVLVIVCVAGIPILILAYGRIRKKYGAEPQGKRTD
jgi:hypothetical protein